MVDFGAETFPVARSPWSIDRKEIAMGQRGFLILCEALLDSTFTFRTSLLVRARKTGRHDDKMRQITT
jgi:hypothetical protein